MACGEQGVRLLYQRLREELVTSITLLGAQRAQRAPGFGSAHENRGGLLAASLKALRRTQQVTFICMIGWPLADTPKPIDMCRSMVEPSGALP